MDHRGYPVPWFDRQHADALGEAVPGSEGAEPDFRVITAAKVASAHLYGRCWICGQALGRFKAFVIGPMCAVNRTSGEPPSHVDCADWSARACPFLSRPHMRRREGGKPEGSAFHPAGLSRNPGATLVWITKRYGLIPAPEGVLFNVGEPVETRWYAEGRQATREEVLASIDSGLPALRAMAEEDGPEAIAELDRRHELALPLLPRAQEVS